MGIIADEIRDLIELTAEGGAPDFLHYGTKRHSGRYPWGSGKEPYQRSGDLLSRVEELHAKGLSEKDIAETIGLSTTDLRMQVRVAKHERRELQRQQAKSLRDDGKTLKEIADIMGFTNDSSVRTLLNEKTASNKNQARATADILLAELNEKGYLDVGEGVERELGCSRKTLDEALFLLNAKGYPVYGVGVPQVNRPGQQTNIPVLCKEGTEYADAYAARDAGLIMPVMNYHSDDGGLTFNKLEYPSSIDSSRVGIRYAEDGGLSKDGMVELRRGVKDLDMGGVHYAQVRIMVDGSHYIKGMAMYSDNLPDGVDILVNSNKPRGTDKMACLKPIKEEDPNNPFGALIAANGQIHYTDDKGVERLSPINRLKSEGDWDEMSRTLSSQFLSKQPMALINSQLDLTYKDYVDQYQEILSLTNPTIKRKMLMSFADECDSAAVHMKAAALPRQKTQVLLPVDELGETEIFAPNFSNGERVALVRYPHGGTFEIPILTVNNKNKAAVEAIGLTAKDAVGINSAVAGRLSGADFDGDTVTVIPLSDKVKISSSKPLQGLINFEAKVQYRVPEGNPGKVRLMTKEETQKEMGIISNLITDMTLRGATPEEMTRAVKHSMVVIDAAKHKLDYKQSEVDNGIAELKTKYQSYTGDDGKPKVGGASTLLSRRKQTVDIPERKGSGWIDPDTGKHLYNESGRTYIDKKTGKTVAATEKIPRILAVEDVRSLSTGTPQEEAYANYANRLKALGNQARKSYLATPTATYDPQAKKTYQAQVDSLNAKLNVAAKNAPRERQAQIIAGSVVRAQKQDNPGMKSADIRKAGQIALQNARQKVAASGKSTRIDITDLEWQAIQAGAISDSKLSQILRYADEEKFKARALPKQTTTLSPARVSKIKAMERSGYSIDEIAKAIGVSTSTVSKQLG